MKCISIDRLAGGLAAACLTLAAAPSMAGSYVYTTLDLPGQTGTFAYAINDSGQVVGSSGKFAFVWDNGTYTSVSAVGTGGALSQLMAVNASGVAAGIYNSSGINYGIFTYNIATATVKLITSSPSMSAAWIGGINARNVVVGSQETEKGKSEGFIAKKSKAAPLKDPSALPGGTFVNGISDAGVVAGDYRVNNGTADVNHGFTYANKVYTSFDPPGSLSTYVGVGGVTSTGIILGSFITNLSTGAQTGFVDNSGSFTNYNYPGAMGTQVTAIGPGGEIFGSWENANFANSYGFVIVSGTYYNINLPGAQNTQINGVNSSGTLVGYYQDSSNVWHGFVAVCPTGQSPCTH